MAKTKKHYKKKSSVGAINKKSLMTASITGVVTFFADQYLNINDKIDVAVTKAMPSAAKAVMPVELGLGGLFLLSKGRSMVKDVAAGVSLGLGFSRLAKEMGIVTGWQGVPTLGRRMAGYQNTPTLGATGVPSALSGIPSALSGGGFRVNGPGYKPTGSGVGVMNGVGSEDHRNNSGYMQ